ncbi:MAG: sigma-70 family RNA polymerase sigma factor [Acidimicrobiales bacterium]
MSFSPADAEIYGKHISELTSFATTLVGPGCSSDVVSSAVISAIMSRTWESVTDKRAYLYRCVLNESRSWIAQEKRRRAREAHWQLNATDHDSESLLDVKRAILQLSPRQRAVTYLFYWMDLSPESIGETLGMSQGSVHRHLDRARKRLRRLLHE